MPLDLLGFRDECGKTCGNWPSEGGNSAHQIDLTTANEQEKGHREVAISSQGDFAETRYWKLK